uniref:kallikrein-6 isoform X1 n=2 Tax=Jaculus jaculus TaxID=51337 RepID=UPI001E1AF5CC|nr:kallikrein-6 isoform X1 [Jaculus jaculus]
MPATKTLATRALAVWLLLVTARAEEQDKVVHGGPCDSDSHPFQAALYNSGHLLCGGVLIHPSWVLTAAHCKKPNLQVYLGKHNLQQREASQQQISVAHTVIHPRYDPASHDNDIMMVQLEVPVKLSEKIHPLPLSRNCTAEDSSCSILGWGKMENGDLPDTIQCANVKLVSHSECERAYPGHITWNMVCAGDEKEGMDSCQGDSGGPLLCGGRLRGIVSWGNIPCGSEKKPGVYTDVCRYRGWIRNTIRSK